MIVRDKIRFILICDTPECPNTKDGSWGDFKIGLVFDAKAEGWRKRDDGIWYCPKCAGPTTDEKEKVK